MNLFEINAEIERTVAECVDAETGEITADGACALNLLEMQRETKLEGCRAFYGQCGAYIEAAKKEIAGMQTNIRRLENMQASLKAYLQEAIPAGEQIRDAATNRLLVSWRKSESLVINDEAAAMAYCEQHLPEAVITEKRLLKTPVKEAVKSGVGINGCMLVTKNNIQIK
jgi:hypothetical protein